MCVKKKRNFRCRPQTAPDGRQFVAEALREWGLAGQQRSRESVHDVLLVTSELLTNAVQASFSGVDVEVIGHSDHVEIGVTDDNPGKAVLVSGPWSGESGRGLQIVAALSSEWGQTPFDGRSKRVWCRVPIKAPTEAMTQACRNS